MEISSKNDLINEILKCGNYDEILDTVKAAKEKAEKGVEIAQAKTNAAKELVYYTKLLMEDNPIFSKLLEDESFMTELNKFAINALEDMKNYLSCAKITAFNPVKYKTFSTDDFNNWDKAIQDFMNKNKY